MFVTFILKWNYILCVDY